MRNSGLHMIANPGIYDSVAVFYAAYWPTMIAGALLLIVLVTGGLISEKIYLSIDATLAIMGVYVVSTIAVIIAAAFSSASAAQALDSYNASVAEWLDADYGIDVSITTAIDLVGDPSSARKPQTVGVTYKGIYQPVKIQTTDTGDLAVADPRSVLLDTIR